MYQVQSARHGECQGRHCLLESRNWTSTGVSRVSTSEILLGDGEVAEDARRITSRSLLSHATDNCNPLWCSSVALRKLYMQVEIYSHSGGTKHDQEKIAQFFL